MNSDHDPFATTLVKLRAYALRPATRRDPTPVELQTFEDELGVSLPEPYRSFVQRWGRHALSSVPRFAFTAAGDPARSAAISQFFGFSTDGTSDLHATMQTYAGRVPDNTVPIGRDPGAGLILMGIDGPRRGAVFSWGQGGPSPDGVSPVALSFDDFVQMLTPDPVYDE
jgi:hypothetical protein